MTTARRTTTTTRRTRRRGANRPATATATANSSSRSSGSSRGTRSQQSQSQRKPQPPKKSQPQKQPQMQPPKQPQRPPAPAPSPPPPPPPRVSVSAPRRHRVLVVGAGISGLAAARELLCRRYDVLVLEGRTRPGGRLRTVPMRLPRGAAGACTTSAAASSKGSASCRSGSSGSGSGSNAGEGAEEGEGDAADDGVDSDDDNNNNNNNRKRSGSTGSIGMGGISMASRLMAAVGLGSFVATTATTTTATTTATTTGTGAGGSKDGKEKEEQKGEQDQRRRRRRQRQRVAATTTTTTTATTTTSSSSSRARTRPDRYKDFDVIGGSGGGGSGGKTTKNKTTTKRKHPSTIPASIASAAAAGGASDVGQGQGDDALALPTIHPLDQRYSTRLLAQENARADINGYDLIPVDLGGAFIHGTGYETDARTGKTNRLDWGAGDVGGKTKAKGKTKADINPLYQLVRSMGIPTVPLDGCTLMDARGNNVDDVKNDEGGGSLDEFVQSKFNEVLDDCHDVISQLKKLERSQRRGEDNDDNVGNVAEAEGSPRKKRRLANGDTRSSGGAKRSPSTSTSASMSTAEVAVKLPDGTKATLETDFATLFNAIASAKSIFLSGKSTLPADLFSWHLNNLEMSCGAPFPALGLKWNSDEAYNFGGDHVVLADGWGRVVENLVEGSVASASAGEGNGPVNIRYGCEVEGIRIKPPENYDDDLVDDVDDQGDDLSDYEALESDDEDDGSEDDVGDDDDDELDDNEVAAKKPAAKAKRAAKAKPVAAPAKKPAVRRANATTPPLARPRSDAGDDAVKTRSRSKPQIRRSSRSNIGQHSTNSASRYSPTFESDLKKFSPIKSPGTKPKKKESGTTPKVQSSKKKPAAVEPMILSPDSSRHPDVQNSTVQVRTKLADGSCQIYEADHVVVTCPLGVLQVPCGKPGHLVFNPPLPKYKRESINKIGFGYYNKIALAFPYRFWEELPGDDFWGVAASPTDRLGGSILAVDLGKAHAKSGGGDGAKDVPVMLLIFGGSYAQKMEIMTDEKLVGDAMEVVRNAWEGKLKKRCGGDTAIPDPVDFAVTRWGQDKFARGSFSYVKPGADGFVQALRLARPVFDPYGPVVSSASSNGKSKRSGQRSKKKDNAAESKRPMILFAGEHTSSVYPSTIHGAFLSGIREATRLDLALEPAMNSYYEYDNKTVYGRTFDLNWRSRYGGINNAVGTSSAKKKHKMGPIIVSSRADSMDTSRAMLEDAAILRGCDVHGTSVDAVARVSELHFPIPAAHAASGKRMTGKSISRRYNELAANGCNATRTPVDEKSWIVEEDQAFVSGKDGSEEELYFDWKAAAAIEREHDEEEED